MADRSRELLDAYAAQTALFTMATRADEKYPHLFAAIRAVLDLHKPDTVTNPWCEACGSDSYEEPISWPCATVRAITAALEAS